MAELRESNAELKKTLANPAFQTLPGDASAALQKIRDLVADPRLASSLGHLDRTLARLDRITGGGEADLTADDREPAPDHRQPA